MPKLTARSIKKIPLPTGTGARDVPDSLVVGLTFVLQPTGAASWVVRFRTREGQQKRYTLGKFPALSVDAARDQAADVLRRVAKGEDPQAEKVAARTGEITDAFLDQAVRFVETYARQQNKSWLAQARLLGLSLNKAARRNPELERHWAIIPKSPAARWQKRTVRSITKREIVEAVDEATERGPIVANRVHATLTRFFNWAVEKDVIEVSRAIGTKAPNPEKSRDRVLTPEELSAIWWAAEELRPPFGAFVQMLILTAARRNEVSGMTQAELAGGAWTIPAARSKNGEPNTLPLPADALEIIAALPRHASGLLFTTTGTTPVSGFSKMKRILDGFVAERMKVAPWTLHDIRRSAATGMAELGVEQGVFERVLGHRISGVTAVYNRFDYFEPKKAALQLWADYVKGAAVTWSD
jgi:integrase